MSIIKEELLRFFKETKFGKSFTMFLGQNNTRVNIHNGKIVDLYIKVPTYDSKKYPNLIALSCSMPEYGYYSIYTKVADGFCDKIRDMSQDELLKLVEGSEIPMNNINLYNALRIGTYVRSKKYGTIYRVFYKGMSDSFKIYEVNMDNTTFPRSINLDETSRYKIIDINDYITDVKLSDLREFFNDSNISYQNTNNLRSKVVIYSREKCNNNVIRIIGDNGELLYDPMRLKEIKIDGHPKGIFVYSEKFMK